MVRLFIGSSLEGVPYEALLSLYDQRMVYDARVKCAWVPPENWHLTWFFLGEKETGEVSYIQDQLDREVSLASGFILPLQQITIWPHDRQPRVLVWRGEENHHDSQSFAERIQCLFPAVKREKKFCPHITLARFKRDTSESGNFKAFLDAIQFPSQLFNIQAVHLYQSMLTSQGALYTKLQTWSLSGVR